MTATEVRATGELVSRRLRVVPYTDHYADAVYQMICGSTNLAFGPKEPFLRSLVDDALATFVAVPHGTQDAHAVLTLRRYSEEDGHAEIGIVASTAMRGSGIAIEALDVVLTHAFCDLGLRKVYAYVAEDNRGQFQGIDRYAELEGVLKGHELHGDTPVDVSIYTFDRDAFLAIEDPAPVGASLPLAGRLGWAMLAASFDGTRRGEAEALYDAADSLDLLELDALFEAMTGASLVDLDDDAAIALSFPVLMQRLLPVTP